MPSHSGPCATRLCDDDRFPRLRQTDRMDQTGDGDPDGGNTDGAVVVPCASFGHVLGAVNGGTYLLAASVRCWRA